MHHQTTPKQNHTNLSKDDFTEWKLTERWLVQPKPTQQHHSKVKPFNQTHFSTLNSPEMKAFALLFHLSRSVSGWYFKHLKVTNKNRSKYYICNPKTFYMFSSSVSCVKYKCVVQRLTLEEHVFVWKGTSGRCSCFSPWPVKHCAWNRPLESGRDLSLEAFRRGRGKKSPPLTGKIMVFVELGWGGNSPKDLGISLIRGFSGNKSAGMESQPPLNECTVI